MTDIKIPPEVVEAAALEIYARGEFITMEDCRLVARAAIAAALAAWPGAWVDTALLAGRGDVQHLSLPLQEPRT
jgi:hypothetical protein